MYYSVGKSLPVVDQVGNFENNLDMLTHAMSFLWIRHEDNTICSKPDREVYVLGNLFDKLL